MAGGRTYDAEETLNVKQQYGDRAKVFDIMALISESLELVYEDWYAWPVK